MKLRFFLALSVAAALMLGEAASALAGEMVWSGLVIANNASSPEPTPQELGRFQGTLKELFGYNQFKVIGQSRTPLAKGDEDWSASSKYFALHVDSRGATESGAYRLNLQLYQEKKLLLETEAKLTKSSPLVIKGPLVGDGQLLLLLVVQ